MLPLEEQNNLISLNYSANLILWFEEYFYDKLGIKPSINVKGKINELKFKKNSKSFHFIFNHQINQIDFNSICFVNSEINENGLLFNKNFSFLIFSKEKKKFISKINESQILISYDLLGMIFIILNRLEEYNYVSDEKHNRFQLKDSCLNLENSYKLPIVDFWITWIGDILENQGFQIKKNKFDYSLSCDVDNIYRYKGVPFFRKISSFLIDLLKDRKGLITYFFNRKKYLNKLDKHNNFDWMITECAKYKLINNFNFIVNNTSIRYDYRYNLGSEMKDLINKLIKNRHKIGIHYSYNSIKNNTVLKEWNQLKKITQDLKLTVTKGRFHYLRFSVPKIFEHLDKTDQKIDESLTFHETGGFRCGTCKSYKPFNYQKDSSSKIIIQPLIIMEGSLLGYSQLSDAEFKKSINYYINTCKLVDGCFTLLWHNSDLCSRNKKLFSYSLSKIASNIN